MIVFARVATFLLLEVFIDVIFCNNQLPALPLDQSLPPLQNEFPSKCFKELGCFETIAPFYHPLFRPVVLLPFDEENIATRFYLFTPRNPRNPQIIDHSYISISTSAFNAFCPTKILIHGFSIKPSENNEYESMKDAILTNGLYNVILVDWSDSNQSPYFQAVSNGRVVGAQVARLIQALQLYTGAIPERFHIIGHSLGAHVAGWAGERIQKIGRITGLDPAGMYFYYSPPEVRLDTSDAEFVDVIITNGGTNYEEGIGTIEPIGHMNFYPNGGNIQPGCQNFTKGFNEFNFLRNLCSHMVSVYLFTESILNERCQFIGTPCDSNESYLAGKCDDRFWWRSLGHLFYSRKSEVMGFYAAKSDNIAEGQKFFLKTKSEPPFCIEAPKYSCGNPHYWYYVKN